MLKLSITQGPIVKGVDTGVVISTGHCKELADFLCEWYETIPLQVANHIEVITVAPQKGSPGYGRVIINVIFSGGWRHRNHYPETEDLLLWKNGMACCLYSYSPASDILGGKRKKEIRDELNARLARLISTEIETYKSLHEHLTSLSSLLEKR